MWQNRSKSLNQILWVKQPPNRNPDLWVVHYEALSIEWHHHYLRPHGLGAQCLVLGTVRLAFGVTSQEGLISQEST